MTDDRQGSTPERDKAYYATGQHMTPEERRRRFYEMLDRVVAGEARQKPKPKRVPDDQSVTPERLLRAGEDVENIVTEMVERFPDGTERKVSASTKRMLDGNVLNLLLSRESITSDQHAAGARLYLDWYTAKLAGSGVIDPGRIIVDGGKNDPTPDHVLEAAGNFTRAITSVGKIHSNALIDLVLLEEKLPDYGRKRSGYKNDKQCTVFAIALLKAALEQLDLHYYGQRKTRMQHSGADGYRPTQMMPEQEAG